MCYEYEVGGREKKRAKKLNEIENITKLPRNVLERKRAEKLNHIENIIKLPRNVLGEKTSWEQVYFWR